MRKYLLEVRFETSKGNLFTNSLLDIVVKVLVLLDVAILPGTGVAEESEGENVQKA